MDKRAESLLFGLAFVTLGVVSAASAQISFPPAGIINTVSGNGLPGYSGDGGPALKASFGWLTGIAADSAGNLFVLDGSRIREIASSTGLVSTVATIDGASALTADASGNLFVSSQTAIREITMPGGTVTTIAGTVGKAGYSGDGGPALQAEMNGASKIAMDALGNIYFADRANHRIRKIAAFTGQISTIVGTGAAGFSGDGGPAEDAQLNFPDDVVLDPTGNLFVADGGNYRIREIVAGSGVIRTIAGTGAFGFSGDGGSATVAQFGQLQGMAIDRQGNLYLADYNNNRVRQITISSGIISTVAGNGTAGLSGDEGPAISAELETICGIAVDSHGYLYILNSGSGVTRAVGPGAAQSPSSFNVTLTSSDPKPRMGEYVTLTAKVMSNLGLPAHSGTMTWYKGSTEIGKGNVDGTGTATFTTELADAGDIAVTARYAGDLSGYATISIPVYGYALTAIPNGPLTVSAGQSGQFTIDVSAFQNFTGPVDLSCEGLPGPGYCTLSTTTINLSNAAATQEVMLTVHTRNPTATTASLSYHSSFLVVALCPICLLFLRVKRLRAYTRILIFAIVVSGLSGAMSGCGDSRAQLTTPNAPSNDANTLPVGTYAFTVDATSGNDTVKQPITVIVK